MKLTVLLSAALATGAIAGPAVMPRITPEQLAKLQQSSPMTQMEHPAGDEAKVTRPEDESIVKQSVILHDGKNWTLVPKGAVVYMPEAMKARVDAKPVGTLLSFLEFTTRNRSWITTNEVSFNQAAGTETLPAERADFWSKQDKVVIAVHQGGPISVKVSPPVSASAPTVTKR